MRATIISLVLICLPAIAQQNPSFEARLRAGQTALQQSRYAEANTQLHAALTETDRPGQNLPPTRLLDLFSTLCDLDLLMGQFDEAISLGTRAAETAEAIPGTDMTLHLGRLAGVYRASGKTAQAVPLLQRILEIDLKLGADDPKVSADYDKLGGAFMEMKQNADARTAYRSAIDTRISRLGAQHVDVATAWVNLGVLEQHDKSYPAARKAFETALAISENALGPESYGLTGILDRMGSLFAEQKIFPDAEVALQRSLAIREKILGPRHSDIAPALENLATVYFFDSKFLEAEPLFQRELQIWIATKGPLSPMVAMTLDDLGALYSAQKRYTEAEPYFRQALNIREEHDLESLSNLALVYQATNDLKRADEYFQRAILIGDKGLGGEHLGVLDKMEEYDTLLHGLNRLTDAKKLEARIKDLKDKRAASIGGASVTSGPSGASGSSGATGASGALGMTGKASVRSVTPR